MISSNIISLITRTYKMIIVKNTRLSSNLSAFRKELAMAKHVVVITGAGVSAESGVQTFRGPGGFWRRFQAVDLATSQSFTNDPSLVWEFYHYRRETMLKKSPNPAHRAIAEYEMRMKSEGKRLVVITQNIDELHTRAGTHNLIELHGNLFKVRCLSCGKVEINMDSPICPSLESKGLPNIDAVDARIPHEQLPRCKDKKCNGLLRPAVVWFGENLDPSVLDVCSEELDKCDFCLLVGTSSVVYPAAMFAPELASKGVTVAEFNIEEMPATESFKYYFQGPCGETLPKAIL